ncbi:hypothetical protein CO661_24065 [Sinorhizobium fredii]|uniref:Uncharacterized protein n=1 Tax=Rhizobium fredii TaxID=380 RepID=A0A2A6LRR1_RHIFR|nr:hypothetical protein [Sinorhizobium fredii]PDT45343.1 hypothetical protein CO661_24065 [Sinorhizobium fredii]
MAKFHQLLAVAEQAQPDCYIATIIADIDGDGTTETVLYGILPDDNYGIAPQVKAAVVEWVNKGQPVAPYVPPTAEELRSIMPALSRRQLLLGLISIGITEATVDAALAGDTEGMIEWKYASTFSRSHPLIADLSINFGLPPEQVDSLWLWAVGL